MGYAKRSLIVRKRKPKRGHLRNPELIEDDIDEVTLPVGAAAERAAGTRVQNQFLQQGMDIDNAALPRQRSHQR
jgi:hypothetical protein